VPNSSYIEVKRNPNLSPMRIGKLQIPEPCSVPWEDMQDQGACNKFCLQCNKVVHDLTGKTETEIHRIFNTHGGNLCASFELDEAGRPIFIKGDGRPRAVFLKQWAAAATTLFFLYQSPEANGANCPEAKTEVPIHGKSKPITPSPINGGGGTGNTLVSGIIEAEEWGPIRDSLMVEFWLRGEKVNEMMTYGGFFHADFQGIAQPDEVVEIRVKGDTYKHYYGSMHYKSGSMQVPLAQAQNLVVTIKADRDLPLQVHLRKRRTAGAVRY
jgi:hypothetical protein